MGQQKEREPNQTMRAQSYNQHGSIKTKGTKVMRMWTVNRIHENSWLCLQVPVQFFKLGYSARKQEKPGDNMIGDWGDGK